MDLSPYSNFHAKHHGSCGHEPYFFTLAFRGKFLNIALKMFVNNVKTILPYSVYVTGINIDDIEEMSRCTCAKKDSAYMWVRTLACQRHLI